MLYTILLVVQVISAIAVVALILIQQGKGADAGASFGGGSASQTFFGSSGSGNFLTRSTAFLVTIFFVASLGLAYYAKDRSEGSIEFDVPEAEEVDTLPGIDDLSATSRLDDLAPTLEPAVEKDSSNAGAVSPQDDLPSVEVPSTETITESLKSVEEKASEAVSEQVRITKSLAPEIDEPPVSE